MLHLDVRSGGVLCSDISVLSKPLGYKLCQGSKHAFVYWQDVWLQLKKVGMQVAYGWSDKIPFGTLSMPMHVADTISVFKWRQLAESSPS